MQGGSQDMWDGQCSDWSKIVKFYIFRCGIHLQAAASDLKNFGSYVAEFSRIKTDKDPWNALYG